MSLNSIDRNYGKVVNPREFWGGDNGWVTVVVKLPAGVEVGTTAVVDDGSDAYAEAEQAANKNLFRIMNAISQRAVIVATSATVAAADPTVAGWETVGGNVLAVAKAGTLATGSFAITFLVERAAVFTSYGQKSGASVAISVNPAQEVVTTMAQAGYFLKPDGTAAAATAGAAVKVFQNFNAIV